MDASIIIPVFNGEKTIKECLESLLNQQGKKNYEIIVVDDGSTDSTSEIAKKFSGKIKYIFQKNVGPAKARNNGAKNARGEMLVFIDSDCIAEKNWLEEMLKPFSDSEVKGVQGSYKTKQRDIIARFAQIEIEERYKKMSKKSSIDFIGSYSAAYRKEIFDKAGGFDERFPVASGEDPELSYKLAKSGNKLVFNPNAIVYHAHPNSLGDYLKNKFSRAYWRVLLYGKHKDKIISDSYTTQALKIQILLAALLFLSAVGWALNLLPPLLAIVIFAALILSFAPFTAFALKRDFGVGIIAMPVMFLRSIVFGAGLFLGVISGVWRK